MCLRHAIRFKPFSSTSMRATKIQPVGTPSETDLLSLLNEWLKHFEPATVRPVLLRSIPTREELKSQAHDIDLLITREQTRELLQKAFTATIDGRCHVQIEAKRRRKTQLILWNVDATERLIIDLWHEWDQFASRRQVLSASVLCAFVQRNKATEGAVDMTVDRESMRTPSSDSSDASLLNAAARLRPELELALLVLHIYVKKQAVVSPVNRRRIESLLRSLRAEDCLPQAVMALVESVRDDFRQLKGTGSSFTISRHTMVVAEGLLAELTSGSGSHAFATVRNSSGDWFSGLLRRTSWKLLSAHSNADVAFVGSDGCGKTSLTRLMSAAHSGQWLSVVARKLYRRSVLYPIASSVSRRIFRISRSEFDDRLAPLIALRAMMACWLMLIWLRVCQLFVSRPKRLLLDRSPESMLIIERRTENPRFSWLSTLLERLAPPMRHVLLLVPYAVLSQRKQEITESAHRAYQQLLFDQMIRQSVVSCVLVSNSASPLAALEVLEEILSLSPNGAHRRSVNASDLKSQVRAASLSIRTFTGAPESADAGDDRFLLPSPASAKKERAA